MSHEALNFASRFSLLAFIRTNCLFHLCAHFGFAKRFSLFAFRFSLFAFRFSLFAFRFSLFATYSILIASTGFSCKALRAGKMAESSPVESIIIVKFI